MTQEEAKVFDAVLTLSEYCISRGNCDECLFQTYECVFNKMDRPREFVIPANLVREWSKMTYYKGGENDNKRDI